MWNLILLQFHLHYVRQSKTDPFRRGQRITIAVTNTSTCPVRALHHYVNLIPPASRSDPLFTGGRFTPLSRVRVTSVIHQLLQGTSVS